ncbi:MAG: hypothetical protein AAB628_02045 [Patescibacteria group bacterium]
MDDFYFSVFTGIATGLIVGILTYLLGIFIRDTIKPWYTRTIYRGMDVSGTWRGGMIFNSNNIEVKTVFNIEQNAFDIKGVFFAETIDRTDANKNYSNQYKFLGQIRNNIVMINYEAMSNKRTGVGTLMLKSEKGGSVLKGHVIHSEDIDTMWSRDIFGLKRD